MLHQAINRLTAVETQQRETQTKLAATEEQLIASKAQIALLSSQAVNRNDEVLRQMKHHLEQETSVIRNTIHSSVGQALRSFVQAHSNTHTSSSSPFDNGPMPPAPSVDSRHTYDRQTEPLPETIFTSLLTNTTGSLTSNPVSPIASHHPDPLISDSTRGAGPSRLN